MTKWEAYAEYENDITTVAYFPYCEDGNYSAECERQQEIEEWLLTRRSGCTFYSVSCVEVDHDI